MKIQMIIKHELDCMFVLPSKLNINNDPYKFIYSNFLLWRELMNENCSHLSRIKRMKKYEN